jgi:hypothetical protein
MYNLFKRFGTPLLFGVCFFGLYKSMWTPESGISVPADPSATGAAARKQEAEHIRSIAVLEDIAELHKSERNVARNELADCKRMQVSIALDNADATADTAVKVLANADKKAAQAVALLDHATGACENQWKAEVAGLRASLYQLNEQNVLKVAALREKHQHQLEEAMDAVAIAESRLKLWTAKAEQQQRKQALTTNNQPQAAASATDAADHGISHGVAPASDNPTPLVKPDGAATGGGGAGDQAKLHVTEKLPHWLQALNDAESDSTHSKTKSKHESKMLSDQSDHHHKVFDSAEQKVESATNGLTEHALATRTGASVGAANADHPADDADGHAAAHRAADHANDAMTPMKKDVDNQLSCPSKFPHPYRPKLDYCCSSGDDGAGNVGINAGPYTARSDTCKGRVSIPVQTCSLFLNFSFLTAIFLLFLVC